MTNGKGFQLYAETPEEKQSWKENINTTIRHLQQVAPKNGNALRRQRETRTFYVVSHLLVVGLSVVGHEG